MCRILLVRAETPFAIHEQLQPFAHIAEYSKEYQGHGWGCAWLPLKTPHPNPSPQKRRFYQNVSGRGALSVWHGKPPRPQSTVSEKTSVGEGVGGEGKNLNKWHHYHNINPIWEDDLTQFANQQTKLLLVHARSAFRDEGIVVENNMPFSDGDSVFIFNGELRGVKIKSEGRIGAEKIYNYIRRMDKGDKLQALEKAVKIIKHRTNYVRAMNILMSDGETSLISSDYSEDPEYFQMYSKEKDGMSWVCSDPFPGEDDWSQIKNGTITELL